MRWEYMPNSTRSTTDFRVLINQRVLDGDKVLLFLKAVDAKDRRELGNFLEDETQPNVLVADWTTVKKAVAVLISVDNGKKKLTWKIRNRGG